MLKFRFSSIFEFILSKTTAYRFSDKVLNYSFKVLKPVIFWHLQSCSRHRKLDWQNLPKTTLKMIIPGFQSFWSKLFVEFRLSKLLSTAAFKKWIFHIAYRLRIRIETWLFEISWLPLALVVLSLKITFLSNCGVFCQIYLMNFWSTTSDFRRRRKTLQHHCTFYFELLKRIKSKFSNFNAKQNSFDFSKSFGQLLQHAMIYLRVPIS